MTYEEVAEVLAKFGVYELEDRSTSHIILRKDLPDGKRLTYPLRVDMAQVKLPETC